MQFSLKYVTFGIMERTQCIEIHIARKIFIFKKCLKTQPTLAHFNVFLSQRINVEKAHLFYKQYTCPI